METRFIKAVLNRHWWVTSPTSVRDGSGSDFPGELTTLYNPSNQAKAKRRTPRCSRQAFHYGCLISQALRKKGVVGEKKSSY